MFKNNDGDVLTIPFETLKYVKDSYSVESILTSKRVQELPEAQQLGYMKAVADIVGLLTTIHLGGE